MPEVIPASTNPSLPERYHIWNRPEVSELARLYGLLAPHYAAPSRYGMPNTHAKQTNGDLLVLIGGGSAEAMVEALAAISITQPIMT